MDHELTARIPTVPSRRLRHRVPWHTLEVPTPDRVLLRKADDGSHREVGDLLERIQGKRWRLVLPDSTEVEHVMKPNEVTVVRGSMNHRLRMSPQDVEAELRDDPVRVFRQLLSESPRGAKASQLKDALYGMDKALVDKAWQRAKKGLDSSADVRRSDSRVPTYSLVEPIPAEPSSDTGLAAAPVKDSSTSDASRATGGPLVLSRALGTEKLLQARSHPPIHHLPSPIR